MWTTEENRALTFCKGSNGNLTVCQIHEHVIELCSIAHLRVYKSGDVTCITKTTDITGIGKKSYCEHIKTTESIGSSAGFLYCSVYSGHMSCALWHSLSLHYHQLFEETHTTQNVPNLDFSAKEGGWRKAFTFQLLLLGSKMTDEAEGSKDALDQCSPFRSLSPRNHSQIPRFPRESMAETASLFTSFRADRASAKGTRQLQN